VINYHFIFRNSPAPKRESNLWVIVYKVSPTNTWLGHYSKKTDLCLHYILLEERDQKCSKTK